MEYRRSEMTTVRAGVHDVHVHGSALLRCKATENLRVSVVSAMSAFIHGTHQLT